MTAPSLRTRLALGAVLIMVVSGLIASISGYLQARHEADELYDTQLALVADTLLFIGRTGDHTLAGEIHPEGQPYPDLLIFQLWQLRGDAPHVRYPRLLMHSDKAETAELALRRDGFGTTDLGGKSYRVLARASPGGEFRAIVGQSQDVRQEMVNEIAWNHTWPYLAVLPVGALALVLVLNHGLSGVRRLAALVAARNPDRLDPIPLDRNVPRELRPLLESLNTLLGRLAGAMENERRFTGDAAHELRTPMAALRAQLDALRLADDEAGRTQALKQATLALDRMGRLVTQLLTLARLENTARLTGTPLDLAELAREVCADLAPAALAKSVELSLEAGTAPLRGEPDALRILLRNLLDNAIRHAPPGSRVEAWVTTLPDSCELIVADNGPGVPPSRLEELGQRFHRLAHGKSDGVGLGLSIVRRIVELHGGRIRFGPGLDGTGLAVSVALPNGRE